MSRIDTLDFTRGLAVAGILLLNIVAFGQPRAAYLNPAWQGTPALSDALTWAALDLVAQLKFLSLFALLFGAGLQMLLPRGKRWIQTRLLLLLLLGMLHGIFLWDGDILFDYGLIGLLICRYPGLHTASPRTLFLTGGMLFIVGNVILMVLGLLFGSPSDGVWRPDPLAVAYETQWQTQGGWLAVQQRLHLVSSNIESLIIYYCWQLAGLMMMGAALMRSGWLRGKWQISHYRRMAAVLIPLGCLINLPAIYLQWHSGWDVRWCAFFLQIPRALAAPIQALGYVALCFGFWSTIKACKITAACCCIGRMALSNYLLQTLLCTLLFNIFGVFNTLSRTQLLAIVPAIWLINMLFSLLWLHFFCQGPIEWLWRRLTNLCVNAWCNRDIDRNH